MNHHPLSRPMMCLLSLLLLTPGVGFAATSRITLLPESVGGLRGQETPHALWLLESPEAPATEAARPSWRPPAVLRVAAELGIGALASVGLGLVGTRIGTATARCPSDTPDGCVLNSLTGLWVGSSLGFALGAWGGGTLLGGRGHILHTLGGMALGMAAGVGAFALTQGTITAFTGAALLLPYALSVVAFEVSSSVHLQPLVSVSPRGGAVLGLAGSF